MQLRHFLLDGTSVFKAARPGIKLKAFMKHRPRHLMRTNQITLTLNNATRLARQEWLGRWSREFGITGSASSIESCCFLRPSLALAIAGLEETNVFGSPGVRHSIIWLGGVSCLVSSVRYFRESCHKRSVSVDVILPSVVLPTQIGIEGVIVTVWLN